MKTRNIATLSLFISMLSLAGLVAATIQPMPMPAIAVQPIAAPAKMAANDSPVTDESAWFFPSTGYFPAQYVNQATEIEELPAQF